MTTERELVFVLRLSHDTSFGDRYLKARADLVGDFVGEGLRGLSDYDEDRGLNGLVIEAQLGGTLSEHLYGHEVTFDMHRVRERDAAAIAATFRRIRRGLDRYNSRLGYSESFADYLLRVADILKVRRFAVIPPEGRTWAEARWLDGPSLTYAVEKAEREFLTPVTA